MQTCKLTDIVNPVYDFSIIIMYSVYLSSILTKEVTTEIRKSHPKAVNNLPQGIAHFCPRLWAFMTGIDG